ncbi:hypothetical protein SDJN03_16165, partial [Cucurbita argyrosperma subsp. sororia]
MKTVRSTTLQVNICSLVWTELVILRNFTVFVRSATFQHSLEQAETDPTGSCPQEPTLSTPCSNCIIAGCKEHTGEADQHYRGFLAAMSLQDQKLQPTDSYDATVLCWYHGVGDNENEATSSVQNHYTSDSLHLSLQFSAYWRQAFERNDAKVVGDFFKIWRDFSSVSVLAQGRRHLQNPGADFNYALDQ